MGIDLKDTDKEQLRSMAREQHFALRERIIELHQRTPENDEARTMLENQVAEGMRQLYEYHRALYEKEGKKINITNVSSLKDFVIWRADILSGYGFDSLSKDSDSYHMFKQDKPRFLKLFAITPYKEHTKTDSYINHWITTFTTSDGTVLNTGDIHTDLKYGHILAFYIEGFTTQIYVANESSTDNIKVTTQPDGHTNINLKY